MEEEREQAEEDAHAARMALMTQKLTQIERQIQEEERKLKESEELIEVEPR